MMMELLVPRIVFWLLLLHLGLLGLVRCSTSQNRIMMGDHPMEDMTRSKSNGSILHRMIKKDILRRIHQYANHTTTKNNTVKSSSSSSSLVEWLDQLQIALPNLTYTNNDTPFITVTLDIHSLLCTHFIIQDIQTNTTTTTTTMTSIGDDTVSQIQFQIRNISATCTGMYHIQPGSLEGTIHIALGIPSNNDDDNNSILPRSPSFASTTEANNAFEWRVVIIDNDGDDDGEADNNQPIRQPHAIQTTDCMMNCQVVSLQFTGGSTSSKIINLFHSMIVASINQYIQNNVCTTYIPHQLDPIVSSYIQYFMQKLHPYIIIPPRTNHTSARRAAQSTTPINTATTVRQQQQQQQQQQAKRLLQEIVHDNDINNNDDTNTTNILNQLVQYETDAPVLYNGLHGVNAFIQQHLTRGLLVSNPNSNNSDSSSTSSTCGGFSDGINGVIRDVLTNREPGNHHQQQGDLEQHYITIPPLHLHPMLLTLPMMHNNDEVYRITIYIHDPIRLSGPALYNIQTLDIFRPIKTNTSTINSSAATNETYFHNEIELLSELAVTLNVTISISDDTNHHQTDKVYPPILSLNETFTLQMNFHQFNVGFDVNIDLKQYYVQHIMTISMIRTLFNRWLSHHYPNGTINDHNDYDNISYSLITAIGNDSMIMDCFLQGIHQVSVHELFAWIQISSFTIQPTIEPSSIMSSSNSESRAEQYPLKNNFIDDSNYQQSLEDDIDHMIDAIVDLMLLDYSEFITTVIYGYIQVNHTMEDVINHYIIKQMATRRSTNSSSIDICETMNLTTSQMTTQKVISFNTPESPVHWYNFHKIGLLRDLNTYLNHSATMVRLNQYIDCTTSTINEMLHHSYVDTSTNDNSSQSRMKSNIVIRDVYIANVAQFQQIQFMSPSDDGCLIRNSFVWNQTNTAALDVTPESTLPHLFLGLQLNYVPLNLSTVINITLLLNDVQFGVDTILHFDEQQFQQMTLGKLFSHVYCLFASINSTDFVLHGTDRHFNYFQLLISTSTTQYDTNETIYVVVDTNDFPTMQTYTSSAYEWAFDIAHDIFQHSSRIFLSDSAIVCYGASFDSNTNTGNDSTKFFNEKPMFLILLAVFMFLQPTVMFMKSSRRSVEDVDQETNDMTEPLLMSPIAEPIGLDENIERNTLVDNDDITTQGPSSVSQQSPVNFMMENTIPVTVRYAIPVSIIVTLFILLISNMSVGAIVNGATTNVFAQQSIQIPTLFEFSLYNTARDMLNAQIYPLFFLVLIFSGIWPYMKLFLMLYAWMGPTSMINPSFRGHLLLKLDALSKFSLVDTYVLVVMMVAFRFHLPLLEDSSLIIEVVPQFGFFGFLLATTLSLLIGHVMVFYHRQVEMLNHNLSQRAVHNETGTPQLDIISPNALVVLGLHSYHMSDGSKRRLTRKLHYVLMVLLLLLILLLCIGISQKSFVFEFGGLAGLVMKDNQSSFSVLSFAASIPSNTDTSVSICIILLQYVFIFYTMVMPFAAIIFLTILWIVPMSWPNQYCMLVMAEIANAWSALEVFCLSIVVALLEIETFANFMVGHKCDLIDQLLKKYHGTIGAETCYSVTASILWNASYLVSGAILYSLLISFVLRLTQIAIHERLLEADDGSRPYPKNNFLHRFAASRWGDWMLENTTTHNELVDESHEIINSSDPCIETVSAGIRQSDVDFLPITSDEIVTAPWDGDCNVKSNEWSDTRNEA